MERFDGLGVWAPMLTVIGRRETKSQGAERDARLLPVNRDDGRGGHPGHRGEKGAGSPLTTATIPALSKNAGELISGETISFAVSFHLETAKMVRKKLQCRGFRHQERGSRLECPAPKPDA